MRLPRLFRTSSFRLTLLYASLTGLSFLVLFVVVSLATERFMQRQIDDTVNGEISELLSDAQSGKSGSLAQIVDDLSYRTSGFVYMLRGSGGNVISGTVPAADVRGRAVNVGGGMTLFVGMRTRQLHEMREMVQRSFALGIALALLVALGGGALVSLRVLRRVEVMSLTSREIVGGKLSQRIPVRDANDEFDHLASSLNAMLDRIQHLMDDLQQVTNDVAHDLRTPLTRLRHRLELAQIDSYSSPGSTRSAVHDAIGDIDGVLETFGAILRIAQIESGARRAGFTDIPIDEVLRNAIELFVSAAEEKGQLLLEEAGSGAIVRGDRELLIQMVANLIENAMHHTPSGTMIAVRAVSIGDCVDVVVTDNGQGIPAEYYAKVLQRFYRLQESRTTPGSGLGLSIASAIAGLHESRLILEDNQPGLRVRVRLSRSMD